MTTRRGFLSKMLKAAPALPAIALAAGQAPITEPERPEFKVSLRRVSTRDRVFIPGDFNQYADAIEELRARIDGQL